MAGQAQWEVNLQISNNLQELYALAEKLQGQLDNMEKSKHEIKLNINEDELNKAMRNLNKMLDSIGKGTKNFTQFENLSKDIQEAVSSVKLLGSAFGKIDKDTGMSEMLTTIKNIDTALTSLSGKFENVKGLDIFNENQFGRIESIFTNIESHLSSIKGVLSDVGSGDELSPLLKSLENIRQATSNIKLGLNLDLGNEVSERLNQKVSQSTTRQLQAYRNLYSAMRSTGHLNKEMMTFYEPEGASASELIGTYQGMIKRAEEQYKIGKSNKYKQTLGSTYDNLKKEIKNASAQLSRAETKRSESGILQDLFGSQTDLSGVISQLETICTKLDEISVSAKTFTDSFKEGLNVNTSIEEVNELTNRVKELETELSNLKNNSSEVAGLKNTAKNLSLGDIQDQVARVRKELDLSDAFKIDIDNKGIVTITQSLSEASNVATTTAQTFRNADDAIANFGKRTSDVANKTKVSVKQTKKSAKDTTSKDNTYKKGNQVTSKDWNDAHKINDALNNTAQLMSNLKLVAPESDFSQIEAQVKSLNQTLISGTIPAKQYRDAISGLTSDYKISADSVSKFKNNTQKFLDSYTNKLEKFKVNPASENQNDAWKDKIAQYEALISKLKAELESIGSVELISQEQIKNISDLEGQIKLLGTEMSSMKTSQKGSNSVTRDSLRLQIAQTLAKYTGMSKSLRAEFEALDQTLAHLGANANVTHLTSQFESLHRIAVETGQATTSLWSAIKDKAFYGLASTIGTYFGLNDVIEGIKKVANTVTDLNTQFTELSKVSDASTSQLYNNFSDFSDIAKEVGGTISDTISATSDWSRNGYDLKQSEELAKVAQIYKNVGDGIDIDEANSSLISTLQGFKLQADDAEHIIDVFNEVSNHEPIDSSGIGEALQRSAASFNAANTSLEKSVALISGTNSVLQDPSKVGNMWKTVSARLRGADTELEDMGEDTDGLVKSTSKLRDMVKGMTGGFDIMKNDNEFKDVYDIVVGIGERWDKLTDVNRASLLEALAGKNQSNALAAALSNIDTIKKSYNEAINSDGSAEAEQEKFSQSIQYSINTLKSSFEELSNTLLSSDAYKGAIDFVNGLVQSLNTLIKHLGTVKTLIAGIGVGAAFKGFMSFRKNLDQPQTIGCYGFRYFRIWVYHGEEYIIMAI